MNIIKILSIRKFTLAVYYTSSDCYQYSMLKEQYAVGTVEGLDSEALCIGSYLENFWIYHTNEGE